jgi:hypothetical protein
MQDLVSDNFKDRLRNLISVAWALFIRKVANGTLPINKEASMQLQYAYILQQLLPLICFKDNEKAVIELETGVQINYRTKEIDLLLKGKDNDGEYKIAVEMKYYKTLASSGGKRGATDIFMKDVYIDLELLENYISNHIVNEGVALVMTDNKNLVFPKNKDAKCWNYDISHNKTIRNGIHLTTPIGGKDINLTLSKSYDFQWEQHENFYFLELEGQ